MNESYVLPHDISPLMRGCWQGEARAFRVLTLPKVAHALRAEVQCGPLARGLRSADPDPDEHLHAGVLELLSYASRLEGLAAPANLSGRKDVRPFLKFVFRHRLVDLHRRSGRVRVTQVPGGIDSLADAGRASRVQDSYAVALRLREYRRLLDRGLLRLSHAIAFGAAYDLDLIAEVVVRLEAGHMDQSLRRPPREAASLLVAWMDEVSAAPAPCRARRALAWILRSNESAGPEVWQRTVPLAASQALDLLLKSQHRAEERVPSWVLDCSPAS